MPEAEIEQMFDRIDTNGSGLIEYSGLLREFVILILFRIYNGNFRQEKDAIIKKIEKSVLNV